MQSVRFAFVLLARAGISREAHALTSRSIVTRSPADTRRAPCDLATPRARCWGDAPPSAKRSPSRRAFITDLVSDLCNSVKTSHAMPVQVLPVKSALPPSRNLSRRRSRPSRRAPSQAGSRSVEPNRKNAHRHHHARERVWSVVAGVICGERNPRSVLVALAQVGEVHAFVPSWIRAFMPACLSSSASDGASSSLKNLSSSTQLELFSCKNTSLVPFVRSWKEVDELRHKPDLEPQPHSQLQEVGELHAFVLSSLKLLSGRAPRSPRFQQPSSVLVALLEVGELHDCAEVLHQ